jgi:hypothetical protein
MRQKNTLSPEVRLDLAWNFYFDNWTGPHREGLPDQPSRMCCSVDEDGTVTLRNSFRVLAKLRVDDDGKVEKLDFDPSEENEEEDIDEAPSQHPELGEISEDEWHEAVGDLRMAEAASGRRRLGGITEEDVVERIKANRGPFSSDAPSPVMLIGHYNYTLTGKQQQMIQWFLRGLPEKLKQTEAWQLLHELTYAENWTEGDPKGEELPKA